MINSIVGFFVAVMVSGLIYIVAHDYWGITDELIWSHSMIGADVLAVVCAGSGNSWRVALRSRLPRPASALP